MGENTIETHARNYVENTWKQFNTYHDHKEKMAYLATVLYLTAASALIMQSDPPWAKSFSCAWIERIIWFSSALIWIFVLWQLLRRYEAMVIVAACDKLRIVWLKPFTINEEQLREKTWHNIRVPRFLYKEILHVSSIVRILFVTTIPLTAIIIWCAVLNWRISTWPCTKM